jgi:hypothetical protein
MVNKDDKSRMAKTKKKTENSTQESAKKSGGGAATGGGINFQAIVTAICGVHILRGASLGWLDGVANDRPLAVWAESDGAGDDIRLELEGGHSVEIQVKKGLQRGSTLWAHLEALAIAISKNIISFGILAVAPDSSATVHKSLAQDIERLGQGRSDRLTDIGMELERRLVGLGVSVEDTCRYMRIRVVHGLATDEADVKTAKELLRRVCAQEDEAEVVWDAMYRHASILIAQRGRWTLRDLIRLLNSSGIAIRIDEFPASVVNRVLKWTVETNSTFQITGTQRQIPLNQLLPMRVIRVPFQEHDAESAEAALDQYRAGVEPARDDKQYDAQWTGRFRKRAVILAGPGLGKSTMIKQLAHQYSIDGYPVLKVSLRQVAASMKVGTPFNDALMQHALDGSGVSRESFRNIAPQNWVVLADGLDECGSEHGAVAAAIKRYAIGYPDARVIITTRPIGYNSSELSEWQHYRLLGPDKNEGQANLGKLIEAAADEGANVSRGEDIARRELGRAPLADAIVKSPQLLCMAASLIARDGCLPPSRSEFFGRIVQLFEKHSYAQLTDTPVSPALANRALEVFGWALLEDPLKNVDLVIQNCGFILASDLGLQPLAGITKVEDALAHWERIGLLERVYHGGNSLLTFKHKTFAEFSAARFLISMPDDARRTALDRLLDASEWDEVIGFAAVLGLGNEIARRYVVRGKQNNIGHLRRALKIVGDRDADVFYDLAKALVEISFMAVECNPRDAFSIGDMLVDISRKSPDIIVPSATSRINAQEYAVRLVAWASLVECGSEYFDPRVIADVMRELLKHASAGIRFSLLGGIRVSDDQDRDLVEHIAIAALKSQSDNDLVRFSETELVHPSLRSTKFLYRVMTVLNARGIHEDDRPNWIREYSGSIQTMVDSSEAWLHASRCALHALADAVTPDKNQVNSWSDASHFLQFSGLISITGFLDVIARDMFIWTKPYDKKSVRSTLAALVEISDLDARALGKEATEILQRLHDNPNIEMYELCLPSVDIPEINWGKVCFVSVGREDIENAMLIGSDWMVYVAANLLNAFPIAQDDLVSLLNRTSGTALSAATYMTRVHDPENATEILACRLEADLSGDMSPIFSALKEMRVEPSRRLIEIGESAIFQKSVETAKSATELLEDLFDRGAQIEGEITAVPQTLTRTPRLAAVLAVRVPADCHQSAPAATCGRTD